MSEAITPWLHILAVAVWIGPQVFLFAAAIPALRTIEDIETRTRVMRALVTRFGWIGWGAMTLIVMTGVSQVFQVADDIPGTNAWDLITGDLRFARVFWEKMVLVALAVGLTAVHTLFVGPQQLRLNEQMGADPAQVRNVRRLSIAISSVGLLASVGAVYLGAVLANHDYALVPD